MFEQPYVDWSQAPEGANAVYFSCISPIVKGLPFAPCCWEKWEDGIIFEWIDGSWEKVHPKTPKDKHHRLFKPM